MRQGPVTVEDAQAEIAALEAQAKHHKHQRNVHRRAHRSTLDRLAELRAQCEAHGITFEAEAESHGPDRPRTNT